MENLGYFIVPPSGHTGRGKVVNSPRHDFDLGLSPVSVVARHSQILVTLETYQDVFVTGRKKALVST